MDLSVDSHSGIIQILHDFHPKKQSAKHPTSHAEIFVLCPLSIVIFTCPTVGAFRSHQSHEGTIPQSPCISSVLYTHPYAAAKITLPQFSISSFLVPEWVRAVKSVWTGWCPIIGEKEKKKKTNKKEEIQGTYQLLHSCVRGNCHCPGHHLELEQGTCARGLGNPYLDTCETWLDVCIWNFPVAKKESAFALLRAVQLFRHISSLPITSLQMQVLKQNHCEKRN